MAGVPSVQTLTNLLQHNPVLLKNQRTLEKHPLLLMLLPKHGRRETENNNILKIKIILNAII